jgi:hypothetical protein
MTLQCRDEALMACCDDGSCRVQNGVASSVLVWCAQLVQEKLENVIECEQRHSFKKTIDCCCLNAENEVIIKTEMYCSD